VRVGLLTNLLLTPDWVRRRKESIQLLDDVWLERRLSVEFVPPAQARRIDGVAGEVILPLFLLPKAPAVMMDFALRHGSGRPALPLRRENSLAAYDSLLQHAELVLGRSPGGAQAQRRGPLLEPGEALPASLRADLLVVTNGALEDADEVGRALAAPATPNLDSLIDVPDLARAEADLQALQQRLFRSVGPPRTDASEQRAVAMRRALAVDPEFRWLLFTYSRSSPVLVSFTVDDASEIHRVHLSYKQNLLKRRLPRTVGLGWAPIALALDCSYIAAQTFHFEFEAPPGLEVVDAQAVLSVPDLGPIERGARQQPQRPQAVRAGYQEEPRRGARVHLYLEEAGRLNPFVASLRLRVARETFAGGAVFPALAVWFVIAACAALAEPLIRHADGGVSLLLVFPALLVASAGRASGHLLVVRTLTGARRLLLFSGVLAFLAAALLPLVPTGDEKLDAETWERAYWIGLAVLALFPVGGLFLTRKLPRPQYREGALEELVRRSAAAVRAIDRFRRVTMRRPIKMSVSHPLVVPEDLRDIALATAAAAGDARRMVVSGQARKRLIHLRRASPSRIAARDTSRRTARLAQFPPRLELDPARELRATLLDLGGVLTEYAARREDGLRRMAIALETRRRALSPSEGEPPVATATANGRGAARPDAGVDLILTWTGLRRPPQRHPSVANLANDARASTLMTDTTHVVTTDEAHWLAVLFRGTCRFKMPRTTYWIPGHVWRDGDRVLALVDEAYVKGRGESCTLLADIRRTRRPGRRRRRVSSSRHSIEVRAVAHPDADAASRGLRRRLTSKLTSLVRGPHVVVEIVPGSDRPVSR